MGSTRTVTFCCSVLMPWITHSLAGSNADGFGSTASQTKSSHYISRRNRGSPGLIDFKERKPLFPSLTSGAAKSRKYAVYLGEAYLGSSVELTH